MEQQRARGYVSQNEMNSYKKFFALFLFKAELVAKADETFAVEASLSGTVARSEERM